MLPRAPLWKSTSSSVIVAFWNCRNNAASCVNWIRRFGALSSSPYLPNFAQVVAVHAESDMRGVRNTAEHKRALQFCILLGLAAFILLGAAASKAEIAGAASAVGKAAGILGLVARTVYEAAAGFVSMARLLSRTLFALTAHGLPGFCPDRYCGWPAFASHHPLSPNARDRLRRARCPP